MLKLTELLKLKIIVIDWKYINITNVLKALSLYIYPSTISTYISLIINTIKTLLDTLNTTTSWGQLENIYIYIYKRITQLQISVYIYCLTLTRVYIIYVYFYVLYTCISMYYIGLRVFPYICLLHFFLHNFPTLVGIFRYLFEYNVFCNNTHIFNEHTYTQNTIKTWTDIPLLLKASDSQVSVNKSLYCKLNIYV